MAPVAVADQSQHERGHGVYLLGRRSRMQWAHRRQFVHGSSVNWLHGLCRFILQGDTSGSTKPPVDTKTKVAF